MNSKFKSQLMTLLNALKWNIVTRSTPKPGTLKLWPSHRINPNPNPNAWCVGDRATPMTSAGKQEVGVKARHLTGGKEMESGMHIQG